MNIVIYGTGGVGGYFGARLAQAGNNVTFIARGKHLEVIQKKGLQLRSYKGDYLVHPAKATSTISEVKDIDLVLICVKTWQLEEVAAKLKPILNEKMMIISLLNGVENTDILCKILDQKNVLGGLCKVVSMVEDFGVINHVSYEPTIVFGEIDNGKTIRAIQLEKLFLNAGITTKLASNIQQEIWTKFLFITTISAIGALTRATVGEMISSPQIKEMMYKTSVEILAVAKAKGVYLPDNILEKQFQLIESQPFETTSSLQRDMMEAKPSELEAQNGAIVKMGLDLGIPTPVNSFIYHCLLPQENKARCLN
ncbi:MAG: 2-dehydropantoate 2-reductase [Lutibacter sp.]|uniref:ketopantoate reductase family protein n=1 Tax=Lutibacter sp. TaxID=1925666 RepID=UPI0018494D4F|nr:2-dehydropantoate 2-reductase [Lutibacter sp.]MBT8318015.1 2-dehydropantoate 2-reductase [Lutibacter sp.]NNJ58874.1 2-dehydropantoate 2-reductase [Lutibacter sp.]